MASLPPAQGPRAEAGEKIIVIDPGHGGIDSGTNGVNGLLERDLVLDEGLRLAKALRRNPNYTVHMTRDTDIFIPLRERVNIGALARMPTFLCRYTRIRIRIRCRRIVGLYSFGIRIRQGSRSAGTQGKPVRRHRRCRSWRRELGSRADPDRP